MAKRKKICILCGNSIIKKSSNDQYVCWDCERENAEGRYIKEWAI